ncbi:hypothetical protein FCL47_18165 [Desulfopila sp. IMCC35006]|uniref:hypothetical protein n=1 Tax=Desulfopila sp. IMCC35006 TaxID=2569542 RepID=UPI0010AC4414|nr:hypothetical protein [Desulfopila sp. IMCC35006]TKB24408.1 hypothetical protein FCL47_18165 [Desulfopila sp. IMCC35006]
MEFGVLQALTYFLKEIFGFITSKLDVILAFFLFLMGYRLFKLSIQKTNLNNGELDYKAFLILSLPAVFISLFGAIFVINLVQINLLIMFLFGALMTGIAFAIMGYLLLIRGVFQETNVEAVWKDKSLILKKASPGTIFALFGVCVIVFSLWKGTQMVSNYQATQATVNKEVISAIDRNVPEVISILKEYLNSRKNDQDKQNIGNSRDKLDLSKEKTN